VLTKTDEVKPAELETCIAKTRAALAKRPAAFPDLIATSSRSGDGIPDLRAAVNRLLTERR
jgi:GTP-binding protein